MAIWLSLKSLFFPANMEDFDCAERVGISTPEKGSSVEDTIDSVAEMMETGEITNFSGVYDDTPDDARRAARKKGREVEDTSFMFITHHTHRDKEIE